MIAFLLSALIFVGLLTALVRFASLGVRKDFSRQQSLALSLGFVALVLVVWWFLTRGDPNVRIVNINILPNPLEVLKAFGPLHFEQALVRNAVTSIVRICAAFAIAVVVAVPLGIYMGTFRPIAAFFQPVSLVGTYVPTVVFLPLSIGWFGATEIQKIWFLFVVYFIAILPLVIKTIADVPDAYLDVAVTKGATQWQLVRNVLFPVAKADIWDHLRGAYGVGWTWIILAEAWANAERGLGYLLEISYRRTRMDRYFAVVIVIVLIAIICDQIWRMGGRLLFQYRKDNRVEATKNPTTLAGVLFGFDGRITRSEFWLRGYLPLLVTNSVISALFLSTHNQDAQAFLLLLTGFCLWSTLAVFTKRLHDRNHSGWFLLVWLVPIVGVVWVIIEAGFLRGTTGVNRYGDDPLGNDGPQT